MVNQNEGFDDTVNQIRMFSNNLEGHEIVILNYQPNLRYFLHQQEIYGSPYWSVFDEIQGFFDTQTHAFDVMDLNWPEDVAFQYNPFQIAVTRGEQLFAYIAHGQDGQVIKITCYNSKQDLDLVYYFDDRGYLSQVTYYQNGILHHRDFLNKHGQWQIREYSQDGSVEVSPEASYSFMKKAYPSMEDVIKEVLANHLESCMSDADVLVVASHAQHNALISDLKLSQKLVYSFYADRFNYEAMDGKDIAGANLIIADTDYARKKLKNTLRAENVPIVAITPYDTRLALGKSNQIKELLIYVPIDGLTEAFLLELLTILKKKMFENHRILVNLVSYGHLKVEERKVKEVVDAINDQLITKEEGSFLDELGMEETAPSQSDEARITFQVLTNEFDIIHGLEYTRLIIDLAKSPDLYTQIAGISAGIPQINKTKTEYVIHRKNGYIVDNLQDLSIAIDYYLNGLRHWNESLVYSVEKISEYLSGQIVKQWKKLI